MNSINEKNNYEIIKIKEKILEVYNGEKEYYITPFLSLRYQYEIECLVKKLKLDIYYFNNGERKVAIIGEINKELNPIQVLEIETNEELKHNEIMGAVLNIGLKREVIGNIYTNGCYLVEVLSYIKSYVIENLNYISHYKVKVVESKKEVPEVLYEIKNVIVSSKRLDNVVSSCFNISRELAKVAIINKDVELNFNNDLKVDKVIGDGVYLSCKRRGKVFIIGEKGRTKKDNIILEVKYF